MIYCVWFPSGGFGHFINAMLSLHGNQFCRPAQGLKLSKDGNSHNVPMVLPKYQQRNAEQYVLPIIDPVINYTALIDNGINDESKNFLKKFADSPVIKICYSDISWPVIAHAYTAKVIKTTLDQEIKLDKLGWTEQEDWCQREKYFLFLRDHSLRHQWKAENWTHNLFVEDIGDYQRLIDSIESFGIELNDFRQDWDAWWEINQVYYKSIFQAKQVIDCITHDQYLDLSDIKDIWTQAVIYYFIWLHYGREVPHNDFSGFFPDTTAIKQWLQN